MTAKVTGSSIRRKPKQRRARQTVDAMLDAVVKVLKREGARAVTTNRVAEVAGVSIGSVYQYFPDKHAIFVALHQRHIEEVDRMVGATLIEHAASSLDDLIRALIDGMIEAHTADPELYELMFTEVPHRADGTRDFSVRLHGAFLLAISSRARELKKDRDPGMVAFVVTHMVESLSHGALFRRPHGMRFEDAKAEAVRAVLVYLHS
ncbi:MAG TPA: TetR/AcrR family transcriptional regulator [Pseudacidobacterium sp.]|jgi:AcrR family transcriptional regulator|nr:TetR/AcrR family transcriptional regulator [Pseudacidobacterium sp.]